MFFLLRVYIYIIAGLPYPPPCCKLNVTTAGSTQPPQNCDQSDAQKQNVEGCKEKVADFLSDNKTLFVGISCGVLVFQVGLAAQIPLSPFNISLNSWKHCPSNP